MWQVKPKYPQNTNYFVHHKSYKQYWDRTRAATAWSRRLTARAMAQPYHYSKKIISKTLSCLHPPTWATGLCTESGAHHFICCSETQGVSVSNVHRCLARDPCCLSGMWQCFEENSYVCLQGRACSLALQSCVCYVWSWSRSQIIHTEWQNSKL
jgi:hypothetical protein